MSKQGRAISPLLLQFGFGDRASELRDNWSGTGQTPPDLQASEVVGPRDLGYSTSLSTFRRARVALKVHESPRTTSEHHTNAAQSDMSGHTHLELGQHGIGAEHNVQDPPLGMYARLVDEFSDCLMWDPTPLEHQTTAFGP